MPSLPLIPSHARGIAALVLFFGFCLTNTVFALDYGKLRSIAVSAETSQRPPKISLSWAGESLTGVLLTRIADDGSLTTQSLSDGQSSYDDTSVKRGRIYHYAISGTVPSIGKKAYGQIASGINVRQVEDRGTVLVLTESTAAAALYAELDRLKLDLIADGWTAKMATVAKEATPVQVKAIIAQEFLNSAADLRSVFLLGNIAVPYSGNMSPDSHFYHRGAWPADTYYGDLDGEWTDRWVNRTTASRPENDNVPNDGKFDQSFLPSSVDIAIGRVDLSNLPALGSSEIELLRHYLDKNHAYRNGQTNPANAAVIDDHLSSLSEGVASFARNGFCAITGESNIIDGDFFTETADPQPKLFSFASGPGTYTSASGVGTTSDFGTKPSNAVFSGFFGSYFGDWDNTNNFLRAPLAGSDATLATFWGNRPGWLLYPLAMGATLGDVTMLTQNAMADEDGNLNINFYQGSYRRSVHTALMGDPTLRLKPIAPVSNLKAVPRFRRIQITWTAQYSPRPIGYNIYRAPSIEGPFVKINRVPVRRPKFFDRAQSAGTVYMVRALCRITSNCGTYRTYNQGAIVELK